VSRKKKQRRLGNFMEVLEQKPKKQERLADPTSKESRRQRALRERKKHKSVYEKAQATQTRVDRDVEAGRKGARHVGPLAEKIRRLNREKEQQESSRV